MDFDVDSDLLRRVDSMKWSTTAEDVIPAWVADMDFAAPPAIRETMAAPIKTGRLGYPSHLGGPNPLVAVFEQRMRDRFGWAPAPERTLVLTDVIQATSLAMHHLTDPGDAIALHVPAYNYFLNVFANAGRRIVPISMHGGGDTWVPSADGLVEAWRAAGVRLVVLVNPHNPTGHVFTRAELEAIAEAARALDLAVVADEIHADLILDNLEHIPFASLSDDAAARTITVTSASKTFNVAALHCAVAHVGHDGLWEKISSLPMSYLGGPSALSVAAHVTAWTACEDWRSALLTQLRDRRDLLTTWASDHGVRLRSHRATYLAWLDFADTRIAEDPAARILDHAQVRVAAGPDYTNPTDIDARTFVRLNFATSHAVLEDILDRITHVL